MSNLYNLNKDRVDPYIDSGQTTLFTNGKYVIVEAKRLAEELAKETRSYIYKVLNHRFHIIGYAVPK